MESGKGIELIWEQLSQKKGPVKRTGGKQANSAECSGQGGGMAVGHFKGC